MGLQAERAFYTQYPGVEERSVLGRLNVVQPDWKVGSTGANGNVTGVITEPRHARLKTWTRRMDHEGLTEESREVGLSPGLPGTGQWKKEVRK